MDETHSCQLYVLDDIGRTVVAFGIIFEAIIVLHAMELSNNEVKVTV